MSAIFIDLDGTLIDPKAGITRSIQYALRELGVEAPSSDELSWCIGPPLWESLPILLGPHGDVLRAIELYRARFSDVGMFEADVHDGIGEMLMDLRDTGLPLFVATSKPETYARAIVDHFGIGHYIDGLFGAEMDGARADKTSLLAHALAETGAVAHDSVMIGDRRHDVLGAQNNDIRSLGVMWGFAEDGELHLAEADALAGAPAEVAEIVTDLLGLDII